LETGFILLLLLRKITLKNLSPGAFLELKMPPQKLQRSPRPPNWIQRALILREGKEKEGEGNGGEGAGSLTLSRIFIFDS